MVEKAALIFCVHWRCCLCSLSLDVNNKNHACTKCNLILWKVSCDSVCDIAIGKEKIKTYCKAASLHYKLVRGLTAFGHSCTFYTAWTLAGCHFVWALWHPFLISTTKQGWLLSSSSFLAKLQIYRGKRKHSSWPSCLWLTMWLLILVVLCEAVH